MRFIMLFLLVGNLMCSDELKEKALSGIIEQIETQKGKSLLGLRRYFNENC